MEFVNEMRARQGEWHNAAPLRTLDESNEKQTKTNTLHRYVNLLLLTIQYLEQKIFNTLNYANTTR